VIVDQTDGINKAHALSASSATCALPVDRYFDTGHFCCFGTDLGCYMRQDSPQAAARTAVADSKEFVAWSSAEPNCVYLVSTY